MDRGKARSGEPITLPENSLERASADGRVAVAMGRGRSGEVRAARTYPCAGDAYGDFFWRFRNADSDAK